MCAKIRQFFSLVAIIILVTSSARAEDEEAGDGDAPPKSCYKYTTDFMKSTTLTLLKCLGEKFKPKDFSEYITRSWCILKCVLKEMGTLTPDGKFDDIASAFYFEENFSSEVQQGLLPNVQGCFGFSEQLNDKDYFCKTYEPFISCLVKALIAQVLPYSINCYVGPGLAIVLDVLKHLAPDPVLQSDANELSRRLRRPKPVLCYNKDCTQFYKIEKSNGTSTFILFDKNMTEVTRQLRKPTTTTSL